MTPGEKCELLTDTIKQLYSKEGRSFSYIGRLLQIDRKAVSSFIKEKGFPEPGPVRHMTPSNQKWLNANRERIKSMLDRDVSVTKIAPVVGKTPKQLTATFIPFDPVLKKAMDDYVERIHTNHQNKLNEHFKNSRLEYYEADLPGEEWKDVLGYKNYEVSNKSRVRHYLKKYNRYSLLRPSPNKNNGRLYITLMREPDDKDEKPVKKNLILARLVAHAFVDGWTPEKNTVNHKDGDVTNTDWTNLEWTTQQENTLHAHRILKKGDVRGKKRQFDYILYKDKYQFKTIRAFAKFIEKSETQTKRYLDKPEKHDIKLIRNCND